MPTVVLIIPRHKMVALRTDRTNYYRILQMKAVCFLDFSYIFFLIIRDAAIAQQIIGCNMKCRTHLFQYRDGRRSILADDVSKVTWTDVAELRCRLI